MPRVLVVCTGNICRSPVAAALLARRASEWGLRVAVKSAGTAPQDRVPEATRRLARELYGLDLSGHRARGVTREMVEGSHLVLCAEEGHMEALQGLAPGACRRIFTLWGFARGEDCNLPDPYFLDDGYARAALMEIGEAVETARPRFTTWLQEGNHGD
ncbi:MAG: low molecular weight protein arginine phosphatase [Euryarchaeota archaeon]|nr:low molecular weight protein arginine phosphatase [Euryarchaeota archaeon]